MNSTRQLFTIQQVSQKCDVSKSTLRFWEKKFKMHISPVRSKGGQRRYAVEQVAVIELIKRLKAEGLSLEGIRERICQDTHLCDASPDQPAFERLANRIVELVKNEIYIFFNAESQKSDGSS
jgi:DNA-binding transcriptional MerR regulator